MRVLINRTDAIGDTLLTLPMAKLIKQHHPEAEIAFLISPRVKDVFSFQNCVDHVFTFDNNWSFVRKFFHTKKILKDFRPDFYFYVGGSHIPSLVSYLNRVKFRGGLLSKWKSFFLLNNGVRQSRSMVVMHELEYNLELLKSLGLNFNSSDREILINNLLIVPKEQSNETIKWLNKEFEAQGFSESCPTVLIHPGMTGHTLNWSSRNYGRLITRLFEEYNGKIRFVVSYTPSDNKFLVGLKDHLSRAEYESIKKQILFYNGKDRGLKHFIGLLSIVDLFVGPSTGPTHLSNILGTPTVAIYSPIKVQSAMRWGPLNRHPNLTKVIVPDVVCGEQFSCSLEVCPYYECMSKIEVEEVLSEVRSLLETSIERKKENLSPVEVVKVTNSNQINGESE